MDEIYIPQLTKAPQQTETVEIQDYLPDLETLTPVQGYVAIAHRGNYLEVKGKAEAIVTLTCDRCLQQYNHRLQLNTTEMIWLQEPVEEDYGDEEHEIALDDLVESLPPQGYFNPGTWLYEQLCLELPQRNLCSRDCPGISLTPNPPSPPRSPDHRWASLESLKKDLE